MEEGSGEECKKHHISGIKFVCSACMHSLFCSLQTLFSRGIPASYQANIKGPENELSKLMAAAIIGHSQERDSGRHVREEVLAHTKCFGLIIETRNVTSKVNHFRPTKLILSYAPEAS